MKKKIKFMSNAEAFSLGYEAAGYGEKRNWCVQYGDECVKGWDAYWASVHDNVVGPRRTATDY